MILDNCRRIFRKVSIFTILNVYLVILAGGVVRCTGSGMGCPDWPKCFGRWIPPTKISELPTNYVDLYSKGGHLNVQFNVLKTWTEYINRLLGVMVGFAIFITLITSFGFWKSNRVMVYYSLAAFILVGFQGWLGAKVVDSNLKPVIISIHMLFALVIVALLLKTLAISGTKRQEIHQFQSSNLIKWSAFVVCLIVITQILIGTQVRQSIDVRALLGDDRNEWLNGLGLIFNLHIAFAYIVVFSTGFLIFNLIKGKVHRFLVWALSICILIEYLGGILMYRFALPAYMQPVHLTCASLLFGLAYYLYVVIDFKRVKSSILN